MVKTQVLNIQTNAETNSLKIFMLIGDEQRQFTFSRQFDQIGNHQVEIITPDRQFGETFKFNQQITDEIMKIDNRSGGACCV